MAETAENRDQYDMLSNNRNRKRTTTDVAALVIYSMFVVVWIGIAIHALTNARSQPRVVPVVMEFLWEHLFFSPAIWFFTWFSVLLIVFYFIMLRWCTKVTVYLTIVLEFLLITSVLILIGIGNHFIVIPILMFCYFIFWIEIQILRKTDVKIVCKIIVDSCKALLAFPTSLLIGVLNFLTSSLLCLFTAVVIDCLVNQKPSIDYEPAVTSIHSYALPNYDFYRPVYPMQEIERYSQNTGLIATFLIISCWIFVVDCLCMMSILHGMFTSWCRETNKNAIPRFTILLCHMFYAYRYHLGSYAYMFIPILPTIQIIRTVCANIHTLKMKFKESPYNIYCFLVIIGDIFNNTYVMCASYGKCVYPSMKDAFKLLIQNPMKFTAARLVISQIILFGLILIPGIMVGLAALHVAIWNPPLYYGTYVAVIGSVSLVITSGILFLFNAAADSVLLCHLEQLVKNKEFADEGHENNLV